MERNGGGTTQPPASGRRIIMFPLPYQGHISPMLQLANLLHNHGFKIIMIHTQAYSPNHSNYPHFTFKSIPNPFTDAGYRSPEKPDASFVLTYLNRGCLESFRECVGGLLAQPNEKPVSCLITDAEFYFTQAIADDFNIPRLVFWACNLACALVYGDFPIFTKRAYFNLTSKDSEYEAAVPEYPFLKVKDIVKITINPRGMEDFLTNTVKQMKKSSGIIWNSFIELQEPTPETISQVFPMPRFTLGPLQKYVPAASSSLLEEDRTVLSWLDAQAPKSVIYISFGSISRIKESEFQQVAYGLANIDLPFVWVVRPGLVQGSEWLESLPANFLETVGDRGRIVKWCPQQEVLAHEATGCFWTHAGWNSILETICAGVPMICSPCLVDQPVNARYVSDVWKIGVLLENGLERMGIESAIKRIMLDKEGTDIQKRIYRLKEEMYRSFDEGGTSHQSLKCLVDYISSLQV